MRSRQPQSSTQQNTLHLRPHTPVLATTVGQILCNLLAKQETGFTIQVMMCITEPRQKWPNQTPHTQSCQYEELRRPRVWKCGWKTHGKCWPGTIHDTHSSQLSHHENCKRALYWSYDLSFRGARPYEETRSPVEEEPRPIPYKESKTHWSSYCSHAPLDLHRVEGYQRIPSNLFSEFMFTTDYSHLLLVLELYNLWKWQYTKQWDSLLWLPPHHSPHHLI